MNEYVPESKCERHDIIPDDFDIEDEVLNKIQNEQLEQLWDIVKEDVTDRQFDIIYKRYKENKTFNEIAKEIGVSIQRVDQIEKKAFKKLRENKKLLSFTDNPEGWWYHGGVQNFHQTGMSVVEKVVFKSMEK